MSSPNNSWPKGLKLQYIGRVTKDVSPGPPIGGGQMWTGLIFDCACIGSVCCWQHALLEELWHSSSACSMPSIFCTLRLQHSAVCCGCAARCAAKLKRRFITDQHWSGRVCLQLHSSFDWVPHHVRSGNNCYSGKDRWACRVAPAGVEGSHHRSDLTVFALTISVQHVV